MAGWGGGARDVREEQSVTAALTAAAATYPRVWEAFEALTWLLARKGHELGLEKTFPTGVYRLYRQEGFIAANTPDITIVYTVNADLVCIVGIRLEPAAPQ